jgi:hypothetical protein
VLCVEHGRPLLRLLDQGLQGGALGQRGPGLLGDLGGRGRAVECSSEAGKTWQWVGKELGSGLERRVMP